MTLDDILTEEGADKQSRLHNYSPAYENQLGPFTAIPIRLLEIGVYQGASIRSWLRWFPNGQITGIDLDPFAISNVRYQHYQGDAANYSFLSRVAADRGPFNVIIDDASHRNDHQAFAFFSLWQHLVEGGAYVIEDIQPWFDEDQESAYNGHWQPFVKNVLGDLNEYGTRYLGRPGVYTGERRETQIRAVTFYPGMMWIFKK